MTTGHELPHPGEYAVNAEEIKLAERRATQARERAAQAGFSAADSFEESARRHERLAKVQDETVRQGVSHTDVHRKSASVHHKAAADDRHLAELKRKACEADLALDDE